MGDIPTTSLGPASSSATEPVVIDAHTHLFPAELVTDRSAHLDRDAWFADLFASPKVLMVTVEAMIDSMDGAGIARSIVCGWPWRDAALCQEHNDFLALACRRYPDRLSWLATVNPALPEAPAEIARCAALGAVGIGELNADAQGFEWSEPGPLRATVEACRSLGLPMLIHCSEPVGHTYPGKGTATPEAILAFLAQAQDVTVIAAHWGGGLPFYELMPEVAALTRNVVYDSAASTYLYDFRVFPTVERLAGAGRILFASDYPVLKQRSFLDKARQVVASDDSRRDVFGGNAMRVFGLTERGSLR